MLPILLITNIIYGAVAASNRNIGTFRFLLPGNSSSHEPKFLRGGESAKPSTYSFRHYHNRDTDTDRKKYFINAFSTSDDRAHGNSGEGTNEKRVNQGNSKEREQLYEAYNLLHSLAQDFHKPFDAPAVIVVGHQTSGKSALIEALMGFQFNQVGGGTKTRRPVALRMQYNPSCTSPLCFITLDNGKEEQRSLADIQAYIELENKRLERDPNRSFDPREINIRMEYRYCPNMIVIDTPGMIHPPKGRQLTHQQRALAQAAREAESLVLAKIRCQDYIILCVEDTTDWKHATTRNIVMQADPQLTRTVLVTTKLDTKLPQFSEAEDLEDFIKAPIVREMFAQMLGGPFFTSVPSGRVGISKDFETNEAFVKALQQAERIDRSEVVSRLGPVRARGILSAVGVSRLRSFLEARVEDSYRRNVARIVPLLQSELRLTESKLQATEEELNSLSLDRLRASANAYRELFSKELCMAIEGTVKANPEIFGETLDTEQMKGGSFLHQEQIQSAAWQQVMEAEVGNVKHKLYGGAQYNRAMREFQIAVRYMANPVVTEDEIANSAGLGDTHNGVNFMRAACIIAMQKAQVSFDPVLESLRNRAVHIMKRLCHIVEHMISKADSSVPIDPSNQPFQDMIRNIYNNFVDMQMKDCLQKCRDDLTGMTRFVTWDMEDRGGSSTLYRLLPTPKKMVEIYSIAVDKRQKELENLKVEDTDEDTEVSDNISPAPKGKTAAAVDSKVLDEWKRANGNNNKNAKSGANGAGAQKGPVKVSLANSKDSKMSGKPAVSVATEASKSGYEIAPSSGKEFQENDSVELTDYYKVMQLTEEMLSGGSSSRTSALVTSLVQYIVSSWRNHFARSTAMKFNCFFLVPFLEDFPAYLRNELDKLYESGMSDMFDIAETRRVLMARKLELLAECDANSNLQRRFDKINGQLQNAATGSTGKTSRSGQSADGEEEEPLDDEDNSDNDSGSDYQGKKGPPNWKSFGGSKDKTADSSSRQQSPRRGNRAYDFDNDRDYRDYDSRPAASYGAPQRRPQQPARQRRANIEVEAEAQADMDYEAARNSQRPQRSPPGVSRAGMNSPDIGSSKNVGTFERSGALFDDLDADIEVAAPRKRSTQEPPQQQLESQRPQRRGRAPRSSNEDGDDVLRASSSSQEEDDDSGLYGRRDDSPASSSLASPPPPPPPAGRSRQSRPPRNQPPNKKFSEEEDPSNQ